MKTKEELIGQAYIQMQEKIEGINWLIESIKYYNISDDGSDFILFDDENRPCVLMYIDWDECDIIFAYKHSNENDDIYTDMDCQSLRQFQINKLKL